MGRLVVSSGGEFVVKSFAWLRLRPKTLASAAGVTVAALAVTGMAFAYEGNPTAEVDLHDGGVWLTKTSSLLVGHFNNESHVLDGGLRAASEDYDVLQAGGTVLVTDRSSSTLTAIDPARVVMGDAVSVPGGAKAALGATTVAILEPKDGKLWVLPVSGLSGFKAVSARAVRHARRERRRHGRPGRDGLRGLRHAALDRHRARRRPGSAAAVLHRGHRSRAEREADDHCRRIRPGRARCEGEGGVRGRPPHRAEERGAEEPRRGRAAAALRRERRRDARDRRRPGLGAAGRIRARRAEAGGTGAPAAPVFVSGCTYGAWGGSAKFIRDCVGSSNDLKSTIDGAENSTSLVFRVNRDVVVLNDTASGAAWLATDNLQRVDNWQDIVPPEGDTDEAGRDHRRPGADHPAQAHAGEHPAGRA